MSRIGKIARRTFLIGSATIVGGVAFGAWYVGRPAPNPLIAGDGGNGDGFGFADDAFELLHGGAIGFISFFGG